MKSTKTSKAHIVLLFTVTLLFVILLASTASAVISGDYDYDILEDGTAKINKYYGSSVKLELPNTIDGYRVTALGGDYTFDYFNSKTTVIIIPDSIISIESNPFSDCPNLVSFKVSDTHPVFAVVDGMLIDKQEKKVVAYPQSAQAENVKIPSGIVEIEPEAFANSRITGIVIPNGVIIIPPNAFSYCSFLETVILPDSIIKISNNAFHDCIKLKSINIPDTVTAIGSNPFIRCDSLKKITISKSHSYFTVIDGLLVFKPNREIISYLPGNKKSSVEIPSGIETIGTEAFYFADLNGLRTISIPKSTTFISYSAFLTIDSSVKYTFRVYSGSYAEEFVKKRKYSYTYIDSNYSYKQIQEISSWPVPTPTPKAIDTPTQTPMPTPIPIVEATQKPQKYNSDTFQPVLVNNFGFSNKTVTFFPSTFAVMIMMDYIDFVDDTLDFNVSSAQSSRKMAYDVYKNNEDIQDLFNGGNRYVFTQTTPEGYDAITFIIFQEDGAGYIMYMPLLGMASYHFNEDYKDYFGNKGINSQELFVSMVSIDYSEISEEMWESSIEAQMGKR